MRKLIIIPLAALGILVGLGLVAAQDDQECEPRVYSTVGAHIEGEWTETGDICESR